LRGYVTGFQSFLLAAAAAIGLTHAAAQTPGQEASVEQLIGRARVSLEHGDLEGTRDTLVRVLTVQETNERARLALTDVLMRMSRWTDAENQARILSRQFPADTEPVYLRAVIAMRRGEPQTSRDLASRCLVLGDTRPEVYKVLALAEYALGQNDAFETHIRAVLRTNPSDAEAQYFLGRYLYEIQHYDQSLRVFQSVLEMEPEHYKSHYYSGLLYGAAGNESRARQEYLAAIRVIESKGVRYAFPYADLGRQLAETGELDDAIQWLTRGMRNDPDCPKAHYEYARALFQKGVEPEIEKSLQEALRLDPGYTEAYYLLARYYKKLGESQLASQALARFKDLKDHPLPSPYGLHRQ
jgi:tetratricopeptide (TPR) repeat protein